MKLCAACCKELPKEEFSSKQWQQKQHRRRCKGCIVANEPLKLQPRPKPSCFICLGEGEDETGAPLRRDCSCRGDAAGFAHLPCLVQYAKQKSAENFAQTKQWTTCPNCLQEYGAKLALDMVSQYISFVETELAGDGWAYRRDESSGKVVEVVPRHLHARIVAHHVKLKLSLKINQDAEGTKRSADTIVSIMKRIRLRGSDYFKNQRVLAAVPPPDRFFLEEEARAHYLLGMLYGRDHAERDSELAFAHYMQAKAIHENLGNDDEVARMEDHAARAKSNPERGHAKEEDPIAESINQFNQQILEALDESDCERCVELAASKRQELEEKALECQKIYEDSNAEFGVSTHTTVLRLNDWFLRFVSSKRVLGAHHDCTKWLKRVRLFCQTRHVSIVGKDMQIEKFRVLRYDVIEDKYTVTGPVEDSDDGGNHCQGVPFLVDANASEVQVVPRFSSPVFVRGLEDELSHMNGKIGDARGVNFDDPYYYLWVHFEDENLEPTSIHKKNIRILIDLPDKE
ncbi:hypothetical protein ACHAWF_016944 [Thalassiosira exigua]